MNNIQRNLVLSSINATMAYLASDGLSAMTEADIFHMQMLEYVRRWRIPHKAPKVIRQIRVAIAMRQEERDRINALITAPGIDFDPFDISEEDAYRSQLRRGIVNEMFGTAWIPAEEASDNWLDTEHEHGSSRDDWCREGRCDMECRY